MSFTFLDLVMTMGFVGDDATDGTYASADNCTYRTSDFGAYKRAAYCATSDEFGLGVMVMIVGASLGDGIFV